MKKKSQNRYIQYFKDNPKDYWFKRKIYGWGWTPVKKEGWITTLIFLIVLIADAYFLSTKPNPLPIDLALFFAIIVLAVIALIYVCFRKGETPKWSWGFKK